MYFVTQFLTFNSKTAKRPNISLWPFSYSIGLAFYPLHTAACRKISEVRLAQTAQTEEFMFQNVAYRPTVNIKWDIT
jgi:hypothetical protein